MAAQNKCKTTKYSEVKNMKKKKRILAVVLAALLTMGALSSCGNTTPGTSGTTNASGTSDAAGGDGTASAGTTVTIDDEIQKIVDETVEQPQTDGAAVIALSGTAATVSGSGAVADGGVVTIEAGGTYVLRGTLSEGRVIVNAPKAEVVLVLDGASITCSYGSPLYIYKSSETTVYLEAGTTNTLTDGSVYTYADSYSSAEDEEPNACLYSKSDLILAGTGTLVVNANANNGITSKDTLKITSATVQVTAKNHGINGKDYLILKEATINVASGGDALRSTNDKDTTLGYIVSVDSALTLVAGEDGIQAETSLTIESGSCHITAGGGYRGNVSTDVSAKGLKAGTTLGVASGTFVLDCADDTIHAGGNIVISGGTFSLTTGDDGIHSDENVTISGGEITVTQSYEGIEGASIDITGGTIRVVSSDDGLNAAGGNDSSGFFGRPGSFSTSSDYYIRISGGVIYVNAAGDGIDSNGNLYVTGGTVYVEGPTDNGNGALDYDGTAYITGGTVVALGSSGMAQNFGSESTQGSILLTLSSYTTGTVTLKDSSGNVLVSYSSDKKFNSVVVSCPSLVQGGTYTITAGGSDYSVTLTSLIYGSGMGGGMPGGGGIPGGGMPGGNRPGGR